MTFVSTYESNSYEDEVDVFYDFEVSVHAQTLGGGDEDVVILLDTHMGYTPYDIFIIHASDDAGVAQEFELDFEFPPSDDSIRVLGVHFDVPIGEVGDEELGDENQTGPIPQFAEIFYGTVENVTGVLSIQTTCESSTGSVFNKVSAPSIEVYDDDCGDEVDIMIQEVYGQLVNFYDIETSYWRLEATKQYWTYDFDGYSLNDEWPDLNSFSQDPMIWFKARNLEKWQLLPAVIVTDEVADEDLVGTEDSAIGTDYLSYLDEIDAEDFGGGFFFDNYHYEDYNFFEVQLSGHWHWNNDEDYYEYIHLMGPMFSAQSFYYSPDDDGYLNFFRDVTNNYEESNAFDGDQGSGGSDFWVEFLVSDLGYSKTASGDIYSPIFVMNLREGEFVDGSGYVYAHSAENQDVLFITDAMSLSLEASGGFNAGAGGHWVVEDDLMGYLEETPVDGSMSMEASATVTSGTKHTVAISATNTIDGTGNDSDSTMYVTYRKLGDYGVQFSKTALSYDDVSGSWTGDVSISACDDLADYLMIVVATDNDGDKGRCEVLYLGPAI